jgi:hypothetical protein
MTISDQYRKQAETCREQAEHSVKPADRAFWLLLAQNWQTLAQDSEEQRVSELPGRRAGGTNNRLGVSSLDRAPRE